MWEQEEAFLSLNLRRKWQRTLSLLFRTVPQQMYWEMYWLLTVHRFLRESPLEKVLLRYNKTAFTTFSFAASENGSYMLHFASVGSTNNVTATLIYWVNFQIGLQLQVSMSMSVGVGHVVSLTPPFDWLAVIWSREFFRYLAHVAYREVSETSTVAALEENAQKIKDASSDFWQKNSWAIT